MDNKFCPEVYCNKKLQNITHCYISEFDLIGSHTSYLCDFMGLGHIGHFRQMIQPTLPNLTEPTHMALCGGMQS